MPKGYWVTIYRSISDPEKLVAYAKLAPPAIAPFGGRYLMRGTAAMAPPPPRPTYVPRAGSNRGWEYAQRNAASHPPRH